MTFADFIFPFNIKKTTSIIRRKAVLNKVEINTTKNMGDNQFGTKDELLNLHQTRATN